MTETVRAHVPSTGVVCELYTRCIDRVRRCAGGFWIDTTSGRYFVAQADGIAAKLRPGIRVSVTYDLLTEESASAGDTADNGWIEPETERRHSLAIGGAREHDRVLKRARSGRFDWTLREALRFIDAQNCAHHETCWTGPLGAAGEQTLRVYSTDAYNEGSSETIRGSRVVSVSYALHIDGCSAGTADRIARMLAANGVYFANRRDLKRAG